MTLELVTKNHLERRAGGSDSAPGRCRKTRMLLASEEVEQKGRARERGIIDRSTRAGRRA